MKPKRLCIICHERPAEVPDREQPGRPINRLCRKCHGARLAGDLRTIVASSLERRDGVVTGQLDLAGPGSGGKEG